jgi:hypothetical protein
MDTAVKKEPLKPWDNIRIFKRNSISLANIYELESKEVNHIITDEEATLHEYRNRISEYENTLANGKNWEYYKKIVNPYELVYKESMMNFQTQFVC